MMIYRLTPRSEKYLVYSETKEGMRFLKNPDAVYYEKGQVIAHHWIKTEEELNKEFPGWKREVK